MIIIKSQEEINIMRESGRVTAYILSELSNFIRPGISTKEIDEFVEDIIIKNNMIPSFKGYNGYPSSVCTSVNEEVVHGIPSADKILREGDIISVDVGSTHKGYVSDAARTYPVGKISEEAQRLIKSAEESFFEGLKYCKVGYRLSDISAAIQRKAESDGFSVVRDFVGHGIGKSTHRNQYHYDQN
jgi:methionyl aminopeptidase